MTRRLWPAWKQSLLLLIVMSYPSGTPASEDADGVALLTCFYYLSSISLGLTKDSAVILRGTHNYFTLPYPTARGDGLVGNDVKIALSFLGKTSGVMRRCLSDLSLLATIYYLRTTCILLLTYWCSLGNCRVCRA